MARRTAICIVGLLAIVSLLITGCAAPPPTGTIRVIALLGNATWSGAVNYTLTPAMGLPITGTIVPASFNVTTGNWTVAYVSGGPPGAVFVNITPSATRAVTVGAVTTFTLNFRPPPPPTGTIRVIALLGNATWSGAVNYTLTPAIGLPITGTIVPASFNVTTGNWTVAYVSGGPPGAVFVNITPSATQAVTVGAVTNFTLNFRPSPPRP